MALYPEASNSLLVGLLALRKGLIDGDQLLDALELWQSVPNRQLEDILRSRGLLTLDQLGELRGLALERHDEQPADDPLLTVAYQGSSQTDHTGERPRKELARSRAAGAGDSRFRILRSHARGGLGEVFLAVDPQLKRQAALKAMQAEQATDPISTSRFLLEAELTAGLEHPGIVPVYDMGWDLDGRPYYVMRFIEGETLKAAILRFHGAAGQRLGPRERALTFRRLLQSLVQACNAVAYAHSRGVVHRDLKPDNIMLGPFGETLVLDWGIAKSSATASLGEAQEPMSEGEGDPSLTRPGMALGTPRYMSPEQAAGDLNAIGPASDVYGLGATLYFLLTGKSPFPDGSISETLQLVGRGIFPAPRVLVRSIDPALEALCLKAMSLRPDDRHRSAMVFGEEIEAWLAEVRYRGEQVLAVNQLKATLTRMGIERAQNLFERERHDEAMLWLARALENVPTSEPGLERVVRSSLGSWYARSRLLERSLSHEGEVVAVAFSPDGHCLATGVSSSTAHLWDVATGKGLCGALTHEGSVSAIDFSPDGRRLATVGTDGRLCVWDAVTGAPVGSPVALGAPIRVVRFSPDGAILATASRGGVPCLWSVETREPIDRPGLESGDVVTLAFDPLGRHVAVADSQGKVILRDTGSGEVAGRAFGDEPAVTSLRFSPDGRTLLTGGRDGKARLWDLANLVPVREFGMSAEICQVDWSNSSRLVATGSVDGRARLWDPLCGQPVGEPLVHESAIRCLSFSPDGMILATGSLDGSIRLWETATGLPIGPPLNHRGPVRAMSFSPDGRRLASGCRYGKARIWRVAPQLPGEIERISCWVRVTTGLDFDEADAVRSLDAHLGWELQRRLHELGGPPPKKLERW